MMTTLLKRKVSWEECRDGQRADRALAEAVILQCIEDMWDPAYCEESRRFFLGEGFHAWAEIACLSLPQRLRLICLITGNEIRFPKEEIEKGV